MASIYVQQTLVPKEGNWHPKGRTILTNMKMCVCPPMCVMGEVDLLWGDGKGLSKVEGWGILQDLIPDVEQLVLSRVPVEGWVIDLNEHGPLDGPSNTVHHNGKAVLIDRMSFRLAVLVNGGGSSLVFPKPVPKAPSQFPNIFFLMACLGAFELAYYPALFGGNALSLEPQKGCGWCCDL